MSFECVTQALTAQSTVKAELIALSYRAQKAVYPLESTIRAIVQSVVPIYSHQLRQHGRIGVG